MTRRRIAWAGLTLALALAVLRLWPHAPLADRVPRSWAVWSADGELLRVTRADDDQYRLWVPLDGVAPALVDAVLLKEDRWFYWHPGVNPSALVRGAARTYGGGRRQGGSTVTMQLARRLYGLNTRTVGGKLRQIGWALWLEARYSKRELLEAYLNVAPFGGNIEGVGAASRIYFGKPADRLTVGEALTLAVVPQRPSTRAGRSVSEPQLLAARARLAEAWRAAHPHASAADRRQLELPIVARARHALPFAAPHFVDQRLAVRGTGGGGTIDTTLEADLQRLLERQIARYLEQHGARGLRNAAALLVDTEDMSIVAHVGSADYWNETIDGQVDGASAKRSPGSTLKPFVYALAIDQGVLHPQTVLRDLPTAFGPFAPENFDGRFVGPVTAEAALIRSRNVPAVAVATSLRQPSLYQFLQSAGVHGLRSESFYGLALPLGGGELTMEELAALYAVLANGGILRPLRAETAISPGVTPGELREFSRSESPRLLSAEAAFVTLDMLRRNPRPDDDGAAAAGSARWPIAWKTGTSWGFRDAWSAGVVGPYVLVVWIGDFEGRGNPAFVGVDAAAPLFFRIADAVALARPRRAVPAAAPPEGVVKVAVCADSGDLPNAECPRTVETWYIPGKSPIRVSQLHRTVALDPIGGQPRCPPYPADTRFEVFEFWSSDMLQLFRRAGMPRRAPPALPDCASGDGLDAPRIASPLRGVSYALRGAVPQEEIALDADVAADVRTVFWFDGRALIGARRVADGALGWRPATSGVRVLRVVDDHGRSAERQVDVRVSTPDASR